MNEITVLDLLKAKGMEDQIQNSKLTRALAIRLREKGYRKKRRRSGSVWVKDAKSAPLDIPQMVDQIVEGL